jgi:hypothetical protein
MVAHKPDALPLPADVRFTVSRRALIGARRSGHDVS